MSPAPPAIVAPNDCKTPLPFPRLLAFDRHELDYDFYPFPVGEARCCLFAWTPEEWAEVSESDRPRDTFLMKGLRVRIFVAD